MTVTDPRDPRIDDPDLFERLNTEVPHPARVWNFWLGGKDNFAADRRVGQAVLAVAPHIVDIARESRAFLGRAVEYLVTQQHIAQFLDIGTGLPTVNNTHQVAQRHNPDSRVVYVDNDVMVLAHARALLADSTEGGRVEYIDADARNTEKILTEAAKTLSFEWPIAVLLLGILGHINDDTAVERLVRELVDAMPRDSFLVINDGTPFTPTDVAAEQAAIREGHRYKLRPVEQLRSYFDGLELVDPRPDQHGCGPAELVPVTLWRPDLPHGAPEPAPLASFCGVARKT